MAETLEQKALRIAQETGLDPVNVLQGMQMGDVEFQMSIAPYLDYTGDIDPSVARFHGLPSGTPALSKQGFFVPPQYKGKPYTIPFELEKPYADHVIPVEPLTVNTIDKGATANTWAHEYRHRAGTDQLLSTLGQDQRFNTESFDVYKSKGWQSAQEINNRVLDIRSSQKPSEIKEALAFLIATDINQTKAKLKNKEDSTLEKHLSNLRDVFFFAQKDINDPLVKKYFKEEYKDFNRLYDKVVPLKSSTFLKFMSDDKDDKDEKAKTAKTFREAM